jgi:hypothetical protein
MSNWAAWILTLATLAGCNASRSSEPAAAGAAATPATQSVPAATHESSGLVSAGSTAPHVSGEAHDGSTINLAALRGAPVVLYFYPKDETPG